MEASVSDACGHSREGQGRRFFVGDYGSGTSAFSDW